MEAKYSGVEILEALESAHNYNAYLTTLIRESADSRELVDFGAGVGTIARRLRHAGFEIACIEPDPSQRKRLVQQGFETLESIASLPDRSTSFIFSLNVLEHIEDDAAAVREIHQKLKAEGKLLVYVPAFECLWSSLDDKVCHHRRYTKTTLRRLVEQEGIAIESVRYADCLGFVAALVFRLLQRSASTLTETSIGFYDRWLFPPSRILDRLFDRWFGKNVYVLCRK